MAAPQLSVQAQGQGAVGADALNTYVQWCQTVAQLRGFIGLTGMAVFVEGTITAGDGGQGTFYWNPSSPGPDNGSTIIVPTGATVGAWVLLPSSFTYTPSQTGGASRTGQSKMSDFFSIADTGAVGGVSADQTAAIQKAVNDGVALVPPQLYVTNSALTGTVNLYTFGGDFGGLAPIDGNFPNFGLSSIRAIAVGNTNGIVSFVENNLPASTNSFPIGVAGYGRNDNTGNAVFGVFGRVDQYATTGVTTNEFDSFNYGAAPSSNLPPTRSIGTAQNVPVALTLSAAGNFNSAIALQIANIGQGFLTGIYLGPTAYVSYGLYIDAPSSASAAVASALIKHQAPGGKVGLIVQGVGTPVGADAAITYIDGSAVTQFAVTQGGQVNCSAIYSTGAAAVILSGNQSGYGTPTGGSRAALTPGSATTTEICTLLNQLVLDLQAGKMPAA